MTHLLDIDQILLDHITNVRLIPSLSKFYKLSHFIMTRFLYQYITLFIKRENGPFSFQNTEHETCLDIFC